MADVCTLVFRDFDKLNDIVLDDRSIFIHKENEFQFTGLSFHFRTTYQFQTFPEFQRF